MPEESLDLAAGFRLAGISYAELWTRYLALGGNGDADDLRRHIASDDCPDAHEHNIIAQALNDVILEQGGDHPVSYRDLYRPGDTGTS